MIKVALGVFFGLMLFYLVVAIGPEAYLEYQINYCNQHHLWLTSDMCKRIK